MFLKNMLCLSVLFAIMPVPATSADPSLSTLTPVCISWFDDLFKKPGEWATTRRHVNSIIAADHNLNTQYTDSQLLSRFAQLKSWNIKMELEVGAVKEWGPTGAKCFAAEQPQWDRFIKLGANIYALALDEPLICTRNSLKLPDSYAVQETADFIARVRKQYPNIIVGDVEPYPSISVSDHIAWIEALNARLSALGVRGLDYYRIDPDWIEFNVSAKGSYRDLKTLETYCRSNSLPFSLIYWSSYYPQLKGKNMAGDDTWYIGIFSEANDYYVAGGSPDEYVLESWINAPARIVPDGADFTYTRSVRDFISRFVDHNPDLTSVPLDR